MVRTLHSGGAFNCDWMVALTWGIYGCTMTDSRQAMLAARPVTVPARALDNNKHSMTLCPVSYTWVHSRSCLRYDIITELPIIYFKQRIKSVGQICGLLDSYRDYENL